MKTTTSIKASNRRRIEAARRKIDSAVDGSLLTVGKVLKAIGIGLVCLCCPVVGLMFVLDIE